MKKKVVIKKRSPAFNLLYYWGKFVGLNTLTLLSNDELKISFLSLFYAFFLVTCQSYVFYRVLMQRFELLLPVETPVAIIVHFIPIISNYLGNTSTWITFAVYQNRVELIVKRFVRAEKTARKLSIVTNYEKSFRKLAINVALITITYVLYTTLVIRPVVNSSKFDPVVWSCWVFSHIISIYTWMTFTWILRNLKQKFKGLNEKVRFLERNDYAERRIVKVGVSVESSVSIGNARFDSVQLLDEIKLIFQLHRELRDLTYHIEKHFDKFILCELITQFASLTLSFYLLNSALKHRNEVPEFILIATVCWCIIPVMSLIIISNTCSATLDEANKTGNIVHTMLSNSNHFGNPDDEETAKINVAILDLLHNKLKISVLGFLDLDASLPYNIIIAATMYLTVMMQF